jgi:hypothetical protein
LLIVFSTFAAASVHRGFVDLGIPSRPGRTL